MSLLSLLIWVPIIGGIAVMTAGEQRPVLARGLALVVSVAALALIWPAQVLRMRRKGFPWDRAFFLTLGKFPEAQGVLGLWLDSLMRRRRGLIEYK